MLDECRCIHAKNPPVFQNLLIIVTVQGQNPEDLVFTGIRKNSVTIMITEFTGDERIELPPKVLETPIIPFDQSPIQLSLNSNDLLSIPYGVMNVKKKMKKIRENSSVFTSDISTAVVQQTFFVYTKINAINK